MVSPDELYFLLSTLPHSLLLTDANAIIYLSYLSSLRVPAVDQGSRGISSIRDYFNYAHQRGEQSS